MAHDAVENPTELTRQLAQALHHRVDELEALFDMLPMGIAIADNPACTDVRLNRAFAAMLGVPQERNVSLSATSSAGFRFLEEGREVAGDGLPLRRAADERREITQVELDVARADGSRIALFMHAAPLFDEEGGVRGAVGVALDVTERRRIETEQRFVSEASRVLASSLDYESTFPALAEIAVPTLGDYCAIDVLRDDGGVARVAFVANDPAKQALGRDLRRFPPSLRVDSHATQVIRTGEPVLIEQVTAEMLDRSAQSAEHARLLHEFAPRSLIMAPLRARGRTLGLMTAGTLTSSWTLGPRDLPLVVDIASRAGLALDNALLYRHAQDANRLKDEFLTTLSHELRTPLNALLGWAQILRTQPVSESATERAVESIERNAQAQLVLINDLLDVSRVISGKLRLDLKPVDIAGVVTAAIDAVRPAARARELEISVTIAPLRLEVRGDADRLQQVVWNLLSNAVKFTTPGGRVEVSVEEPGNAVQISVRDTGIGIDPAFLPYVFDRFRQADSSTTRAHGGLGLGLAIARHLIDLHGGIIMAESDGNGRGARFSVTLPAASAIQNEAIATSPDGSRTESAMLDGLRVLAVDDDPDARELTVVVLQSAGAEVAAVASADAALSTLDAFNPHVVLADIAMPAIDGYELLRAIRQQRGDRPPVIALTAYVTPDEVERAKTAGFARHLGKPVPHDVLIETIASVAGQRA
jgi:PAS domain S-box-containing protein